MKFLYIFPHPDDESFGPAPGISKQVRMGHQVYLLTLTRGEATRVRFKLGVTKAEMGEIRYREMQEMAKVLNLTELIVLDLPDSGLKELDPRIIENVISNTIERIRPQIIITYPVHGISGFHDHLVTHAVVKRVFAELSSLDNTYLRRLAFFTLSEPTEKVDGIHQLNYSTQEEIDCIMQVDDVDVKNFHRALDCYKTYQEVIEASGVRKMITQEVHYEIYRENHHPPLKDLTQGIDEG